MGYNVINSLIYAIVFLYLIPKLVEEKFKVDLLRETIEFLPYILFFLFLRVFADLGLYERNFFTTTPGIWLIGIAVYLIFLYFNKRELLKKLQYLLLAVAIIVYLSIAKLDFVNLTMFLGAYILALFFYYGLTYYDDKLLLIALSHAIDAAATIVGVNFLRLAEEHVISSMLGNGILIMLAKGLALYLLFYIERADYLIASIFILGLLTGGRNLLLLMAK